MDSISATLLEKEAGKILKSHGFEGAVSLRPTLAKDAGYEWMMDGKPYKVKAAFDKIGESPVHAKQVLKDLKSGKLIPVRINFTKIESSPSPAELKQYPFRKRSKILDSDEDSDSKEDNSQSNSQSNGIQRNSQSKDIQRNSQRKDVSLVDVQNARDAIDDAVSNLVAANTHFNEVCTACISSTSRDPKLEEKLLLCRTTLDTLLES